MDLDIDTHIDAGRPPFGPGGEHFEEMALHLPPPVGGTGWIGSVSDLPSWIPDLDQILDGFINPDTFRSVMRHIDTTKFGSGGLRVNEIFASSPERLAFRSYVAGNALPDAYDAVRTLAFRLAVDPDTLAAAWLSSKLAGDSIIEAYGTDAERQLAIMMKASMLVHGKKFEVPGDGGQDGQIAEGMLFAVRAGFRTNRVFETFCNCSCPDIMDNAIAYMLDAAGGTRPDLALLAPQMWLAGLQFALSIPVPVRVM